MAEIIIMPKLGFNMSTGKLVKWYKEEGESVKKGEPIFAIETDKTSIDIEAVQDGVFRKKFIEEGDSIEVTLPIAIIAEADENINSLIKDINKQLKKEGNQEKGNATESKSEAEYKPAINSFVDQIATKLKNGMLKITPRARRVAKENGLNLDGILISGTGYDGGICEKDILSYLEEKKLKISPLAEKMALDSGIALDGVQGSGSNGKIMKNDIIGMIARSLGKATSEKTSNQSTVQYTQDGKEILEEVSYSGVRKIIGDRLSQSKFTAPHLYFTQKVNLERLLDLRKQINGLQENKISVTDYIAKAVVKTLQTYPEMNASLIGDKIIKYKSVNIGIAVASPTGLIVPVVKQAEQKSVIEISSEASVLFGKARNGKLSPNEYSGGTFTISNLGMFGIENFTAIINPPESGILAISATKDEPFVETLSNGTKTITIKPMMNITLSVDHRVIDGLLAAQFVTEVKRILENPIEILI